MLLHSYLTPDHEQRIKAIFEGAMPGRAGVDLL